MNNNPFNMDNENVDRWIQNAINGSSSTDMIPLVNTATSVMIDRTKKIMGTIIDYKELMMMYACAIKEVQTKFEILNTEFNVRYQRNPISSIHTRLKKTASIAEKLAKHGLPFSLDAIEQNIKDIAGIRIICPYIEDIYKIAEALLKQDDITLVSRKDYIAEPKPNGYRSLHLIIKVPVFFSEHKKLMNVEVQIRTIAMDFWASLEHQLKYKQSVPNQEDIVEQLTECANIIHSTDMKMQNIRRQIEAASPSPTEDDILFDKLSKLDIGIE